MWAGGLSKDWTPTNKNAAVPVALEYAIATASASFKPNIEDEKAPIE